MFIISFFAIHKFRISNQISLFYTFQVRTHRLQQPDYILNNAALIVNKPYYAFGDRKVAL